MTSFRQIAANRRNASKSTGPTTEEGKQRSRCNAVRHGLTAETVISALEDAEDYKAFEAAITADYDAHSAVERELVLRLASLLWRLRRATTIETNLFEIQADQLSELPKGPASREIVYGLFGQPSAQPDHESAKLSATANRNEMEWHGTRPAGLTASPSVDLARCLRLEPISKSSEEDNEAGELDKAEKVLSVVLPADEDATLPLYPGEKALDEPASHVTV
jgi:hypothetical protein